MATDHLEETRQPSKTSLRALSAVNFFLADVCDGLGPFVGMFLRSQHWDAGHVGIAMAASQIGTLLAQAPAGALIDRIRWKRRAVAVASIIVAVGCVSLSFVPALGVVVLIQTAIGAAGTIFPPAVAAITLSLVGRARLSRRTGRNEAWNHGGNVMAGALAGVGSYLAGYHALFALVAAMAAATAFAALSIRESEIDHELARGADDEETAGREAIRMKELFSDRRIRNFAISVILFHFANAAMLPLVGQKSSDGLEDRAAVLMSACIMTAQVVMIPAALLASRLAVSWGRKPVLLVGFGVLPVRGLLYCVSTNPYFLVGVQLLDGVGAGIFGVVSILVVADITRGTGRFNLTQGLLATATGIGAGLSHLVSGFVVNEAGFNAGFVLLAAIALCAVVFLAAVMPETIHSIGSPAASSSEPAARGLATSTLP
jgi:MFS family permease